MLICYQCSVNKYLQILDNSKMQSMAFNCLIFKFENVNIMLCAYWEFQWSIHSEYVQEFSTSIKITENTKSLVLTVTFEIGRLNSKANLFTIWMQQGLRKWFFLDICLLKKKTFHRYHGSLDESSLDFESPGNKNE